MVAPLYSNAHQLQSMLRAAVQSVHWTYSLFWQFCPQKRVLVWGDGYYNGAIKTRKTVHPVEVSSSSEQEASLERSQQLRELYDSLLAGDLNHPAQQRPSASLSPEDLTQSEWFYLMCVSFSYPPGQGLPGKAYVKQQHIWLTGANEVPSKLFTRAILAKSARIQTVVCIPLLNGVVELGTTEKIQEKIEFIRKVKSFFIDYNNPATHQPKPALSEHSTSSNLLSSTRLVEMDEDDESDDEDDEDDDDGDDDDASQEPDNVVCKLEGEQGHEVMLLEMSQDSIRLGSPEDGSNIQDSDFNSIKVSQPEDQVCSDTGLKRPHAPLKALPLEDALSEQDIYYSQTLTTILESNHRYFSGQSSDISSSYSVFSGQSAFTVCTPATKSKSHHRKSNRTSQFLLKYMIFNVPSLHTKSDNRDIADSTSQLKKSNSQEELSANHVLAERRRREKLNERFIILRSLVPFVTKMDKASILGDTIEYVKQLCKKIRDLEARENRVEETIDSVDHSLRNSQDPRRDKRKIRVVEQGGARAVKAAEMMPQTSVEVSIIESDGLVEINCPYNDGLLLDVMMKLKELRMEITAVHSTSSAKGGFVAELRTKVKENVNGKKASIMEVKNAIKNIVSLQ
nr:bHLH19 [Bupleurum chinense]